MLFDRIVESFERKRIVVEREFEEERLKQEKFQKIMDTIHYLKNGGVELELHKLVYRFLEN